MAGEESVKICPVCGDGRTWRCGETRCPHSKPADTYAGLQTLTITLLPGCDRYAADLKLFIDAMIFKLYKNRHKGHWDNKYTLDTAFRALELEARELHDSLRADNLFHLIEECADCANFALILASVALRQAAKDMGGGTNAVSGEINADGEGISPGPAFAAQVYLKPTPGVDRVAFPGRSDQESGLRPPGRPGFGKPG